MWTCFNMTPAQPLAIKPSALVGEAPSPSQSLSRTVGGNWSRTAWGASQGLKVCLWTPNAPNPNLSELHGICRVPWGLLHVNLFWRVVWVREAVAKQCIYWCVTHVSILCIPFFRILRMYSIRSSGRVAMSVGWLVCLQVFLVFP